MIYYMEDRPYPVVSSKVVALEGINLNHLTPGEHVGIGFPYLHSVYRISDKGELNFSYHYTKDLNPCPKCTGGVF